MKKKTHEEYINEVTVKNPNIEVVGKYIDAKTKILHKCIIHNAIWEISPTNILSGKGCPICGGNAYKKHEDYIKELSLINSNIEVIENYINAKTPILHKCKIDGCEWYSTPNNILRKKGCPQCARKNTGDRCRATHEEYILDVFHKNLNIEVVGTYIDRNTKILHRCLKDGHEWYATPNNILHGYGCPKCKESKGEKRICNWLDNYNIIYEQQKNI